MPAVDDNLAGDPGEERGQLLWARIDAFRSCIYALAVINGHDADAAIARHREAFGDGENA